MLSRLLFSFAFLCVIGLMLPVQNLAAIDPGTCLGAWIFDEEDDVIADISKYQ
jgi:hypothetical protein